jgi:hypothetical protein
MKTTKLSDKAKGVLLRPLKPFAKTRLSEVIGSTGYKGRRMPLRDFDSAILREAGKRR